MLAHIHVLEGVGEKERKKIAGQCQWRQFVAEEQILDRDSSSSDVYFVVDGEVRVVNYSIAGREVQFASFRPGDHFGDLAAIDGLPRSATVNAVRDTTVAVIKGVDFLAMLQRNSMAAMHVLNRLALIVRACDDRIMDLSTLSAYQRVYVEILRRAKPDKVVPDQWIVRPYPPEREIASRAGTTRETVARAVSQLRQAGLVLRKDRNLYIKDRDKITDLVENYRAASSS
ncbi:MAG: Crp/Fnr family transcriptional regulator [Rhodospirillales bacterium]|nr:Crp/Fnr family transcriptional regulator [Rhodospirillales bacterium]